MEQGLVLLIVAMLVWCGGYSVYCAVKLKRQGCLFPSKVLYPGNCKPEECADEVGYMTYIIPRLWVFSAGCLLSAALIAVGSFVELGLPVWVSDYLLPFLGLPIFIWYMVAQSKAAKLYW